MTVTLGSVSNTSDLLNKSEYLPNAFTFVYRTEILSNKKKRMIF